MAKNPYLKFYLGDYIKDTRILPLNVRGAWVDLILFMWDHEPKGEISGTIEEFSRLMCCSIDEANLVIQTLKQKKIFDYHELPDGIMKIESRKQKSMVKLSETRSKVGELGGNPKLLQPKEEILLNQNDNLNCEYEYKTPTNLETGEEKGVKGEGKGWNQRPGDAEHSLELPEIKQNSVIELLRIANGKSPTKADILDLWMVFKVQNFTGENYYQSPEKTFSHFVNWSKQQKINGTHQQQPNRSNPKTAGVNKLLGILQDDIRARGDSNTGS